MKKENLLLIGLAVIAFSLGLWALRLNNGYNNLLRKKAELEDKLTQSIKDKDFLRTQLDDLEKRLEEETQGNRSLAEQLDEARETIRQLQDEVLRLTQEKQDIDNELRVLKEKEAKGMEEIASPVESVIPSTPALPETGGFIQQESPSIPEEGIIPISQ
jgi:predicted nuclease with TOPRIM domain